MGESKSKKSIIPNTHKCNGLWKKFTNVQKKEYNRIRDIDTKIIHPNAKISQKDWETISHNYACMAAWNL